MLSEDPGTSFGEHFYDNFLVNYLQYKRVLWFQRDMRIPIQYALFYPERLKSPWSSLMLDQIGILHFEEPDTAQFPAIELGRQAMCAGGTLPAVMSAANEVAVERFLAGEILGLRLLTLHSVSFYLALMDEIRQSIAAGGFSRWSRAFLDDYRQRQRSCRSQPHLRRTDSVHPRRR